MKIIDLKIGNGFRRMKAALGTDAEKKFHGNRVRQYLNDTHSTVVDLAKAAGVSQGALSNWINGVRNPKRSNVKSIANALRCRISDISDYSDDEPFMENQVFETRIDDDQKSLLEHVYATLQKQVGADGQSKVAERLGVSQSYIGDLYNRKTSIENLKLLAFLRLCPNMKITFGEQDENPLEQMQTIIDCLNDEEINKMLAVLKIVFPQYVK